ncbi:MAG: cell division protein FtsW [Anaerolineaceae bacterium]|nr:cell division protein FtsW [Anaerolineaceae bacterium]
MGISDSIIKRIFVSRGPGQNGGARNQALRLYVDVPLLIAIALLLIIGLVMVLSASMQFSVQITDDYNPYFLFIRQAIFVAAGVVVCFTVSRVDYHIFTWKIIATGMMAIVIFMLIAALLVEKTAEIPKRTLFSGSVQPSELAKVVTVIYLAVWIGNKKDQLSSLISGMIPLAVIISVICGLIVLQPDISAVITILVLASAMFFMGEGDWRYIVFVVVSALIAVGILYFALDYVKLRIDVYIAGLRDMANLHEHLQQAVSAIIRGGWFGTNLGEGSAKFIGLPVSWTDSIFAVIVEETGFIGGLFLIILYMVILWRGLVIAENAPDLTGKLLASGLTCWITFEAILNMGVMVNIFPVAGNALPLISYGGSMMLTTLASLGILFSVNRYTLSKISPVEERSNNAAVDLRRRDGGRGISRAERPSRPRPRRS